MVDQHFDEIDAEFAITEGGGATLDDGRVATVQIGDRREGAARGSRLVATGTSGHGSVPRLDNARRAPRGRGRQGRHVGDADAPQRDHARPTSRSWRRSARRPRRRATARCSIRSAPPMPSGILREHEPGHYSMLRTSRRPDDVQGAALSVNVIPSEAEADARHPRAARRGHPRVLRADGGCIDDPAVKIVPLPATRPPSPASRIDTEMYRVLEQVGAAGLPGFDRAAEHATGASDQAQLRGKGYPVLRHRPGRDQRRPPEFGAHSDVERLLESSLYTVRRVHVGCRHGDRGQEVTANDAFHSR